MLLFHVHNKHFFFFPLQFMIIICSLWLTDFVIYIVLQKILISFSLQFRNRLSPESKPYCKSLYPKMKSCSVRLTPLKGSQSVTQRHPSSVATNPEAAYDGLGGHLKLMHLRTKCKTDATTKKVKI